MKPTYIVYKTTNLINKKFYIGVHCGSKPNYLGSGRVLNASIKKYGRENFIRETLAEFDTVEEAYEYEAWLVTPVMINRPDCYNQRPGGKGNTVGFKHTEETRKKISDANKGKTLSEEHRKKMSDSRKRRKIPVYIVTCPHCGLSGAKAPLTRHHFNNCKAYLPIERQRTSNSGTTYE